MLYGAKLLCYMHPYFVSMIIFALEIISPSLNMDQVHFVLVMKGFPVILPNNIDPVIVNNKQVAEETENML